MLIDTVILSLLGLSFGISVAAGIFAFITMLGVVPRLAHRTGTAVHLYAYETCIIVGGALGNILILFERRILLGNVGLIIYGLFSGIFVGCLAMALAENLRVMPIFSQRLNIRKGMPIIVLMLALGKVAGTIFQYFFS